jgi:predicted nucleic acid-binding protein
MRPRPWPSRRAESGILLDTSFLSALGSSGRPSFGAALTWYQTRDERDLFTCAVVICEIARGITRLEPGRRRERYRHWLRHEVLPAFGERVLPFDAQAALRWGAFMGKGERAGVIPSSDAKIAAVASVHGLTVVTADERHFAALGVPIVNPLR